MEGVTNSYHCQMETKTGVNRYNKKGIQKVYTDISYNVVNDLQMVEG